MLASITTVSVEGAFGSLEVYGLSYAFLPLSFASLSKFSCSISHCCFPFCPRVGRFTFATSAGVKSLIRSMSLFFIFAFRITAGFIEVPALSANRIGISASPEK